MHKKKHEGEQRCVVYKRVGGRKLKVQDAVIYREYKGSCAHR